MDVNHAYEIETEDIITYIKIVFIIILFISINKLENKIGDIKQEQLKEINRKDEKEKRNTTLNERKIKEKDDYNNFLKYKDRPKNPNDPLIKKEKRDILKKFESNIGQKINPNDINIYLDMKFNFGNQLTVLNKLIFYCEIIRCKKIILQKDNNVYIKNTIYDKEYDLKIEVSDKEEDDNALNNINIDMVEDNDNSNYYTKKGFYYMTFLDNFFYYTTYNLRLENRFSIFKNEILKNLPKTVTNINDLYIHMRGSDIFENSDPEYAPDYAQPPLCFYQKVIESRKFRKIYIISIDKQNPVINELIKNNKKIIYKQNKLEKDIAALAFAYNIVGSISSFLISIIKLNNNLKYLWEYDRYPTSLGIPHLHHSLYNFKRKYTLFKMEPSDMYKNEMIIWQNTNDQIQIMLDDTCPHNFTTVNPNL